ncbi:MAG TPA: sulfotransferase [Solirubrobacteraceae bacterium]|nr:sulfotransferase [Solirubrobacteraceae bacterium]
MAESAASQPPEGEGRIPDFFVVGHEKCGTTALYEMLRGHPQVFMPRLKEPRFFSPDMRVRERAAAAGRRPRDLESYRALFAPARPDQRVGEASPQYLGSHVAAERIAALQPAAKIVAILREPVSYLHAMHRQNVKGLLEDQRDLHAAMALERDRRAGRLELPGNQASPVRLLYSEHVRYQEQLLRYEARFPRAQILVLIYEEYQRENEPTVRGVWRFLDLDDSPPVRIPDGRGARKAVRFMPLHKLSRAVKIAHHSEAARSPLADAVYALTPRPAVDLWRRLVYSRPAGDAGPAGGATAALDRELRRRLKPEVQALGEHLGRDLVSLWGYDRL